MAEQVRSVKVVVTVDDYVGLYENKVRASVEQVFPADTATLASISAWTTRTVANAIRDAQRSFPVATDTAAPLPLDKPLSAMSDEDAAAIEALPF